MATVKSVSTLETSFLSLTTASRGVDPEEARATVSAVRTTNDPGPQSYPLPPGERVQPDVPRHHGHVQVVTPFRLNVHVTAKYLNSLFENTNVVPTKISSNFALFVLVNIIRFCIETNIGGVQS